MALFEILMNDIIFQSFPRKGMLELKLIANQNTM